jgi:hypothetical protein
MVATTSLYYEDIIFSITDTGVSLAGITTPVTTGCSTCTQMPVDMFFDHNLTNPSVLKNFLFRNNLSLDATQEMYYSDRLSNWVCNQHFYGVSDDNSNDETWRFTFEFACTDTIAGETASPVVKFSMLIVRHNQGTGVTSQTRLLITIPPVSFCKYINNFKTSFTMNINTHTLLVTNSANIVIQSIIISDKIGIFSSSFWASNPILTIKLHKAGVTSAVARKDISNILPQNTTLIGEDIQTILGLPQSPYLIQ